MQNGSETEKEETEKITRITSFEIDHDRLVPGLYISRIDGDLVTYDLRMRVPNGGSYLSDCAMHSIEHMMATYLRNSDVKESVIYFGPMGCRTGFYLIMRDLPPQTVRLEIMKALRRTVSHQGAVFGASRKECGNYRCLNLEMARRECAAYLAVLEKQDPARFDYPV